MSKKNKRKHNTDESQGGGVVAIGLRRWLTIGGLLTGFIIGCFSIYNSCVPKKDYTDLRLEKWKKLNRNYDETITLISDMMATTEKDSLREYARLFNSKYQSLIYVEDSVVFKAMIVFNSELAYKLRGLMPKNAASFSFNKAGQKVIEACRLSIEANEKKME